MSNLKKVTKAKPIFDDLPQPPADAVFRLWEIRANTKPHPFCIGPGHWPKEDWQHDIDVHACGCYYTESIGGQKHRCNLSYAEHITEYALLIVVPDTKEKLTNLSQVPGLHEFLKEHKDTMAAQGVAGFGFVTEKQYRAANPPPNKAVWPPRTTASWPGVKPQFKVTIKPELEHIRGNKCAHFSITAHVSYTDGGSADGCCHDEILKAAPEWKPLVDLHLCDIDGTPMHGAANGHYYIVGGQFLAGEWSPIDYQNGDRCGKPMSRKDLDIRVAEHFRITYEDAVKLRHQCEAVAAEAQKDMVEPEAVTLGLIPPDDFLEEKFNAGAKASKALVQQWAEGQKARWKAEADDAIEKFQLNVTTS